MGLLLQLLLLARGRVLLLSWTGSASGWRSPRKLGAAQAVTDAGAHDGARFEVAVDATRVPEAIETASGCSAMAGGWWSSVCRQPRPRSASRRSGFITTNRHHRADGYLAQLRPGRGPARQRGGGSASPAQRAVATGTVRRGGEPGSRRRGDQMAHPAVMPRAETSHDGRTAGIEPQPLLRRAGLDRVPAGAISISSRARHTFLVANYVPSPISVSRPLRRRYRCRTARLGSKPRSVLIAPEPGGGPGRGPGCDLVAFGERPDRLDARAGGRRPGCSPAVMIAPAGPCDT